MAVYHLDQVENLVVLAQETIRRRLLAQAVEASGEPTHARILRIGTLDDESFTKIVSFLEFVAMPVMSRFRDH